MPASGALDDGEADNPYEGHGEAYGHAQQEDDDENGDADDPDRYRVHLSRRLCD